MAPIVIKHIVSFTSEDPEKCVTNLCNCDGENKPWLCSRVDHSGLLKAELQLERAATIGYIDVGNFGSAFVQVDVGRSSWPLDHPYTSLLPTATLMSPADSRRGTGKHTVRMFKKADFLSESAAESWDRLRITCSQPFNKRGQFGLSFLRLRTADEDIGKDVINQEDTSTENNNTPDKMTEWIFSPAVQHTFFGRNTGECSAENKRHSRKLNWAERMVAAARSTKQSRPTTTNNNINNSEKRPDEIQNTQRDEAGTSQKLKRKAETRHHQASMTSVPKRSRSPELTVRNRRLCRTPIRTSNKNENLLRHCPVSTPATDSLLKNPDNTEHPESVCPICGASFSPDYLPLHASSCLDSNFDNFTEVTPLSSNPTSGLNRDAFTVPCPLCSFKFSTDCIEQHASTCGDTV